MGRVEGLWLKRASKGLMDPVDAAQAVAGYGLEGNANVGGRRQVTIVAKEVFDRLSKRFGQDVDPALRRANVLVSGIDLEETRGRTLRLGEARLTVGGETRPCHLMDEALSGLRDALDPSWSGGVFCIVTEAGRIQVGDEARLE